MTGAGAGGAFTGMSAACAAPPSVRAANTLIPSKNSFRMKTPIRFVQPTIAGPMDATLSQVALKDRHSRATPSSIPQIIHWILKALLVLFG